MRHENDYFDSSEYGCTFQMSTQEMAEYLVSGEAGGVGGGSGGSRRLAQLQSARQAVDKMSSADKKKLVASR